jgi:two-component system response regulator
MRKPTRILIVEDNPDDEALLMRQLRKADLHPHIKAIHDGGKALDYLADGQLKRDELAAIFLDLKLPTVSGLELLQAIRANERTREIPVIVMTSSNTPTDLEKCRELGVFSYVAKPLTFSSFAKAFADTFQALREQKIHAKVD